MPNGPVADTEVTCTTTSSHKLLLIGFSWQRERLSLADLSSGFHATMMMVDKDDALVTLPLGEWVEVVEGRTLVVAVAWCLGEMS